MLAKAGVLGTSRNGGSLDRRGGGCPQSKRQVPLRDVKEEEEVSLFSQRQKCHALHRPIKCVFSLQKVE